VRAQTLFISYTQHRENWQAGVATPAKNDKEAFGCISDPTVAHVCNGIQMSLGKAASKRKLMGSFT